MTKYRICKNKYGYFKIQRLHQLRIFGIRIGNPTWIDVCYTQEGDAYVSHNEDNVQKDFDRLIQKEQKRNQDWIPILESYREV